MSATVVIGSQWGDEGKGKIIDYLSETADFIVRYHGGNNAGHTVINQYGIFPMHLIPSGIFSKAKGCITSGTVIDLDVLAGEIELLQKAGVKLKKKLFISPRCHIIMPYHKLLDRLYEEAKGKAKTGTTGRGIGPVYADKVSYNGIRLIDMQTPKQFSEKLHIQLTVKNKIITALGEKALKEQEIETHYTNLFKKIKPFIVEPLPLLQQAAQKKKTILFEGAHGMFLDTDWGTYPFVTASSVVSGNITAGAGLPPMYLARIIGVVKAYTTRVGAGPFPTELFDTNGEKLRSEGHEFGTTTGRPRRCGWFDAVLIRFAAEVNGYTEIAITKLDVLDNFAEIKICTGYTFQGKAAHYLDGDAAFLEKVQPRFITVKGWQQSTKDITTFAKLPKQAQAYIKLLDKYIGVKVRMISTGPEREAIIVT